MFDSGVGGLSIAKCISEQLPHENLVYVADTLHAPYGDKSIELIIERVNTIAHHLVKQGAKVLVIACNTATVNAVTQLREQLSIPIIGVEPAIKPAALQSESKKVAVLVTQATSENSQFKSLIAKHQNGAEVFIQPCPGLVEKVEQGLIDNHCCEQLLRSYLSPLIAKKVDRIVLGCTHYPFLLQQIERIIKEENASITLVETALPVTLQLINQLEKHNISASKSRQGTRLFYSSQQSEYQQQLFSKLWQSPVALKAL
ncbi:glutamate racemase [Litorilituus lipolyticus]|uniref:Glutamate racemase n=1 Tax=Litorilituus lipolyticus TaxID=2491017 RepID=A0A502L5B2_9GAMM|nr:glutamate racemase [Litorilituus lipolyticus]